jgi:hypothetical protein
VAVATHAPPRSGARFQRSRQQRRLSDSREPSQRSLLLLPDRHYPHEDKRACAAVDLIIDTIKPTEIGLLGDFIDCGRFSRFPAKSMAEQAQDFLECEIKPAQSKIKAWRSNGVSTIWMIEGNHEFRTESWLMQHGMADLLPLVGPRALLEPLLDEWIPYAPAGAQAMPHKRIAEDFIAIHSWSHARNAATVNLGMAKSFSVAFGHTHRLELASARHPILQAEYVGVCPGTNSELQPRYGHGSPSGWGHGALWVLFNGPTWTAYNIQIKNGSAVLPTGEVVRA